jgi:hypothetical protein
VSRISTQLSDSTRHRVHDVNTAAIADTQPDPVVGSRKDEGHLDALDRRISTCRTE